MAQYTPNFNLYEPDSSDDFADFRTEFNNNMNIIDQNLGGGGGSGGHTIYDKDGNALAQESGLQFTGNVNVSDDSVNGRTVVDILGGGGNVYGAFLDPSRVIYSAFTFDSSTHSWTATEDCILTDNMTPPDNTTAYFIRIDGKQVFAGYSTVEDPFVYVKKGQVVEYRAKSGSTMKAYGITQGTNGIFAPVIYSDNERVIGVWRDNKPLYQKTLILRKNGVDLYTYSGYSYLNCLPNDIEFIDIVQMFMARSGGDAGYVDVRNNYNEVQVVPNISNQSIYLYDNHNPTDTILTIRYTKTTDVAGSGDYNTYGVPTVHYDTNEQVIGTWITGKPLYEITVEVNSVNHNDWTDVFSLADADIKGYDSRTSYAQLNNGERVQLDWFVTTSIYNRSIITNSGTKFRVETQGNNYSKIVATIQYTKTTDV